MSAMNLGERVTRAELEEIWDRLDVTGPDPVMEAREDMLIERLRRFRRIRHARPQRWAS